MKTYFDIDWNQAVARALLLRQLGENDIHELHEMENTTAKRYYGKYDHYKEHPEVYMNWLIPVWNIHYLFFNKCKITNPNNNEKSVIIDLIKRQIPQDVEPYGMSHSVAVEWQHAWDWNCSRGIPVLDVVGNKKSDRSTYGGSYNS